jgi:hypothetical protein
MYPQFINYGFPTIRHHVSYEVENAQLNKPRKNKLKPIFNTPNSRHTNHPRWE